MKKVKIFIDDKEDAPYKRLLLPIIMDQNPDYQFVITQISWMGQLESGYRKSHIVLCPYEQFEYHSGVFPRFFEWNPLCWLGVYLDLSYHPDSDQLYFIKRLSEKGVRNIIRGKREDPGEIINAFAALVKKYCESSDVSSEAGFAPKEIKDERSWFEKILGFKFW